MVKSFTASNSSGRGEQATSACPGHADVDRPADMNGFEGRVGVEGLSPDMRRQIAQDPGTAPELLQSLAEHYPETRADVAQNPTCYPALLQWLGGTGDPRVVRIVEARLGATAPPPRPPSTPHPAAVVSATAPATASPDVPTVASPRSRRSLLVWGGSGAVVLVLAIVAAVAVPPMLSHSSTRVVTTIQAGTRPVDAAVAADGTLYVTDSADGVLTIIKGDKVSSKVRVGPDVSRVAVLPDGTAYVRTPAEKLIVVKDGKVANTLGLPGFMMVLDGTLFVSNGSTNSVTMVKGDQMSRIETGGTNDTYAPLAPGSDGNLYVATMSSLITIKNGKVVSLTPLGDPSIRFVAGTSDGTAYIANSEYGTVSVVGDSIITGTIKVGQSPDSVTSTPDGTVYVTSSKDQTISVIKNGQFVATISAQLDPADSLQGIRTAAAKDNTVYIANSTTGTVLALKGGKLVATITVGKNPGAITVAPNGTVYVLNRGDGTVSVIR
jgi:WD40 repeat protein